MDAGTDWVVNQGRYALDIDGSNDHVACASNSIGNFGTADATISIWVKTADAIANRVFITKREFSGSFQQWSLMQGGVTVVGGGATGKYISLFFYNAGSLADASGTQNFRTTSDYIDGQMHHFAATRTNGTVPKIYVDGVSVAVTAIVDGRTNINGDGTKPITIGASTSGGVPVLGQVDDARLYTRALSESEIRLLASRRGIAYELTPRRRSRVAVITSGFSALRPSILRGSR
jgi:hypothetical protein